MKELYGLFVKMEQENGDQTKDQDTAPLSPLVKEPDLEAIQMGGANLQNN